MKYLYIILIFVPSIFPSFPSFLSFTLPTVPSLPLISFLSPSLPTPIFFLFWSQLWFSQRWAAAKSHNCGRSAGNRNGPKRGHGKWAPHSLVTGSSERRLVFADLHHFFSSIISFPRRPLALDETTGTKGPAWEVLRSLDALWLLTRTCDWKTQLCQLIIGGNNALLD